MLKMPICSLFIPVNRTFCALISLLIRLECINCILFPPLILYTSN
ncbi:hypothetical protein F7X37_00453 [Candidatus Ecksteinia adelgidicola]|nr:hypothetical protein F7X37_00453 [Candidatus Ecksteinia adelgidicola]